MVQGSGRPIYKGTVYKAVKGKETKEMLLQPGVNSNGHSTADWIRKDFAGRDGLTEAVTFLPGSQVAWVT